MSAKEEAIKGKGFEFCQSIMGKCCSGSAGENAGKFDFKNCGEIMKKFCGGKEGKFDLEAFRSKMEQFCKSMKKESNDSVKK
jgi:hypothetical protein